MTWKFRGKDLDDSCIPEKAIGFVYLIVYVPTGQRYIGRKLLTKATRHQKNKKIIKGRAESDWRDYWSSSPEINKMIEENGTSDFTKQILVFANNKSELNYMEECLQYTLGVLETDGWLNSNIRSKAFRKHIFGKQPINEMRELIRELSKD